MDRLRLCAVSDEETQMMKSKKKRIQSRMSINRYLLLILIFALVLRLKFFVGLNFADDPGYSFDAYRITQGEIGVPGYLPGLRSGMIYPIAFFFKFFGVSNASATMYPLLCSLGSIVLIYLIGKFMFDEKTGLIAALLLSFYPLNVINATWIMPDVPIAFFISMGAFLFLLGDSVGELVIKLRVNIKRGRRVRQNFHLRARGALFFFSGISVGIAYLTRASGLIILLFIVPYMLYRTLRTRKIEKSYVLFFAGMLMIFLLESTFYMLKSGEPENFFIRYNVVTGFYHKGTAGINSDLKYFPNVMFNLGSGGNFRWDNRYFVQYGLFYYFIVLALIYVLMKWERRAFPLVFWLLALFIYSEFGSMSLKEFVPIHKLHRHLTVLTIPALTILAYLLSVNLGGDRHILRRVSSFLIVIFLLSTSVFYIHHEHMYLKTISHDTREIYEFLKNQPEKPIYVDPGIGGHLNFYFKFQRNHLLRCFPCEKNCDKIRDSYVILKGTRGQALDPYYESNVGKCLNKPLNNWEYLTTIRGPEIDIFGFFDPEIYYAPP